MGNCYRIRGNGWDFLKSINKIHNPLYIVATHRASLLGVKHILHGSEYSHTEKL